MSKRISTYEETLFSVCGRDTDVALTAGKLTLATAVSDCHWNTGTATGTGRPATGTASASGSGTGTATGSATGSAGQPE